MKKAVKKAVSGLLVMCMILSMLTTGVFAEQTPIELPSAEAPIESISPMPEATVLPVPSEEPGEGSDSFTELEQETVLLTQAEVDEAIDSYLWLDNDRKIEYPAGKTTAAASSTQSGYGAGRMLDGDESTKWEASWSNAPAMPELTFTLQSAEYVTGFMYMSRLDNNNAGIMKDYEVYASADGATYGDEAVSTGTLFNKLGTFFVTFEEPVLAKSIKITSTAQAITELRLTYQPNDYDSLLAGAKVARAAVIPGSDINQWDAATLEAFDAGLKAVEDVGKPEEEIALRDACVSLFKLTRDLKRAKSVSTEDLRGEYDQAVALRSAAVEGTKPLQWATEALTAIDEVLASVGAIAGGMTARQGEVQDAGQELSDAIFTFRLAQVKPEMATTLTTNSGKSLDNLMDGVTESRYQGNGANTDKSKYIELDYQNETQFESLAFYSWWANKQAPKSIQVGIKVDGQWEDVDGGETYALNWATYAGTPSEKKTVTFATPVKGSALRIYIITQGTEAPYVGIDELEVGIGVSEDDMRISLNKTTLALAEGEHTKLVATVLPSYATNKNVNWTSSNPAAISVGTDGTVKGVALPQGETTATATITATTAYGGKTATCEVTLSPKRVNDEDKADTLQRVNILDKLATASQESDYKVGALMAFRNTVAELKIELGGTELTVGDLARIGEECTAARKTFNESALVPIHTARALIDRVTGQGSGDRFTLEVIPADVATGMDVYEVDWAGGKPVLRGNTAGALATAYNYYLKYFAYLDFPYIGDSELILPSTMPMVSERVRIVFPYEYRHYFNENCEYKYTTSLYGQEEWEHRLDWMAMNGFNMFLVDIGEHAIWLNAKDELGMDDAAVDELLHSNKGTEQYYGEYGISEAAAQKEGALAKFVTQRGFDLGMEPEIRPFVGQIPFMFPNNRDDYYKVSGSKGDFKINQEGSVFNGLTAYPAARWMNLPQGLFISPEVAPGSGNDAEKAKTTFNRVADIYYASLMETLGFDEYGRTPEFGYKDMVGEQGFVVNHPAFPQKVVSEMSELLLKQNPDSVWMQTSWRYSNWLVDQYKPGSVMFVDLKAENHPKWSSTNEFGGTPWVWSMLFNFGGNTGLGGGFDALTNDVISAADSAEYMKGVSISPEGGDTNPALYALMAEMTWRREQPDMEQWLRDYAKRRYGAENYEKAQTEIDSVWMQLYETVYSGHCPGGADGPSQTLINANPKLTGAISRVYGTNNKVYASKDIIPIWQAMLDAAEKIGSENVTAQFKYDLVDITRQALGDISGDVYTKINPAYQDKDKESALKYAGLMVDLCEQMDAILATDRLFLAGTRLNDAKNRGVTDGDKAYFEKVERTFMTYWVLDDYDAGANGGLIDYCNRHLAGLMTDYYGMRWQAFYDELDRAMTAGSVYSQGAVNSTIKAKATAWTEDRTPCATEPTGDSVAVSRAIMAHYAALIQELYPIDKTALQALYEANKDKVNTGNTAESWEAFQAALSKAKTALDTSTTQKAVDDAYTMLVNAINGLVIDPATPNGIYDAWHQDAATVKPNADDNRALCGTVGGANTMLRLTGSADNGQNDDSDNKPTIFVNETLNAAISATEQNTVSFDFTPHAVLTEANGNASIPLPVFGFYMNYVGVNENYFIGYNGSGWNWQRYGTDATWGNITGPMLQLGKTYSVRLQWTGTHLDLFQVGPKDGIMTTVMNGTEAGANMAAGGAGKGFGIRVAYSDWYKSLTSLDISNMVYTGQGENPAGVIIGKVTNNHAALPNATVTSGTARAITGEDGSYTLHVAATEGASIKVAYPGLASKEIAVSADGLEDANVDMVLDTTERPVISEQPAAKTVTAGASALFVVRTSDGATYQWQRSNDLGATWSDIEGATESQYNIAATSVGDSGAQFRCKITASEEGKLSATVTSDTATLTVAEPYNPPSSGSSTTITETVKNEDGSKTTTVKDKKTGTVTKTTQWPDGKKVETITQKSGDKAVSVTDKDGSKVVEITISAEAPAPEKPFIDVPEGHWSKAPVDFVAGMGIFTGASDGTFSGEAPMTRGMLTTVLHRLSGRLPGGENTFDDVKDGAWYADSVTWAAGNGIVTGNGAGFDPNGNITRESLAVMLHRYAGLLGLDIQTGGMVMEEFGDSSNVSAWASDAMLWCVENGILQGSGSMLNPGSTATRAEVAAMLQRFVKMLAQ